MPSKNDVVFAFEKIGKALDSGLADLVELDWEEVTVGLDYPPFRIDWNAYLAQERAGQYVGISARKAGQLIGFDGFDVFKPKRHAGTMIAYSDSIFIEREHRAALLAARFVKEAHDLLKTIGVQWVIRGDMAAENLATAKPRATFGDLLTKMGYAPFDRTYILKL